MTVILRLNKHGLLPMIRVRAQSPTCLCLERSERNDKKNMKALVLKEIGKLVLEKKEKPKPKDNEVLIKVIASGICNSDIDRVFKTGTYHFPTIPGHEFSGIIVETGKNVDTRYLNKRVVIFPLQPCMECVYCRNEEYARCENYNYFGSRCDGGFAEYIAVPIWNVVCFSENLSFEEAAMCETASVALHGIQRANIKKGESVLIQGSGTIGLLTGLWLKNLGLRNLIFAVRNTYKKNLLTKLGFTSVINLETETELEGLKCLGINEGVDVAFDCVGSVQAVSSCIQFAKKGGRILLFGNPTEDIILPRNIYWKILRNELSIIGSWNSSYNSMENNWKTTIEAMEERKLQVTPLITHRFSLEESELAFHILKDKVEPAIKIMFIMKG